LRGARPQPLVTTPDGVTMKLHRTFWMSTAATAAVVTVVVSGVSAASADQAPTRPSAVSAVSGVQPNPAAKIKLGKMIHTGLDATPVSEWVIKATMTTVVDSKNKKVKVLGFGIYERANNGHLDLYDVISDMQPGTALKAGFHAPEHPYTYDGDPDAPMVQPGYGYFVGKPAKITGTVDGKQVKATMKKWSANSKVTVFWFDNTKVTGDNYLSSVSAYNSAGKRIAKAHVYSEGE
jgi:hypothetical protein